MRQGSKMRGHNKSGLRVGTYLFFPSKGLYFNVGKYYNEIKEIYFWTRSLNRYIPTFLPLHY